MSDFRHYIIIIIWIYIIIHTHRIYLRVRLHVGLLYIGVCTHSENLHSPLSSDRITAVTCLTVIPRTFRSVLRVEFQTISSAWRRRERVTTTLLNRWLYTYHSHRVHFDINICQRSPGKNCIWLQNYRIYLF